jgi:trehalose 6-phosphate synthase
LSRLVVVSNRVSVTKDVQTKKGGLAIALDDALNQHDSIWFGWNGRVTPGSSGQISTTERGRTRYCTISLSQRDYSDYYQGYSNRVLWPLFHNQLSLFQYQRDFEEGYQRVNMMLSIKLQGLMEEDDIVWIHDYHCIPLGRYLREVGCRQRMGFFLHIPFPPYEIFRALPNCDSLLTQLCAYDLLGFQTEHDRLAFIECVRQLIPQADIRAGGAINLGEHSVRTGAFPISIDIEDVRQAAVRGRQSSFGRRLSKSLHERRLIIGVDRIDYSKGLVNRFRAYERLLTEYSSLHRRVVLLQVGQPSRGDVPEYREIQQELAATAGEINSHYAEFDWMPLRYLAKGLARSTVLGFLSLGAVGLVTPLRDGMNLVAKEYVAAQDPDDPGVLVLSELTGAAHELDAALLVNPYDQGQLTDAMAKALHMSLDERQERWAALMARLTANDVHHWCRSYLDALENTEKTRRVA